MKKNAKKITSYLLVLVIACAMYLIPNQIVASTTYDINDVVQYAESKVGTDFANGMCLKFVRMCFQDCYGFYSSACCAYEYGNTYIEDSSRDNIPIGADVFFAGSDKECSTCENQCGHIGIYVGNGYIIHTWSGKVTKMSIDTVISKGYPYRGWGWHGIMDLLLQVQP